MEETKELYDLVIVNGRIMDPETDLDTISNLGITDGKIVASGEIDGEALQRSFDSCIGVGDESNSPILKLSRHLFPDEQTSCKRANPLPFNPLKGD